VEGREKPRIDKYKSITNDWNYDASCMLTSLPIWDLKNFKSLIFVAQSVQLQFCILYFRFLDRQEPEQANGLILELEKKIDKRIKDSELNSSKHSPTLSCS
jgi:hypothetical protein